MEKHCCYSLQTASFGDIRWAGGMALVVADGAVSGRVGVLGATSLVGACLLPQLVQARWQVTAFSRRAVGHSGDGVAWRQLPVAASSSSQPSVGIIPQASTPLTDNSPGAGCSQRGKEGTPYWVCLAPVWVLPDYFALLEAKGVRRLVLLSSTSCYTKADSLDPEEQGMALRLAEAEGHVQQWATRRGVEWVILRPTLIYGLGLDKNISEIARLIRRCGFFPLLGKAKGLRQPIHAADVAAACLAALREPCAANRAYNISGGETLTYRRMVARVFAALGRRPRLLRVPLWAFRLAVALLSCLPRYRHWSAAMAERMGRDLVFDHSEAARDLGFKPRRFDLEPGDLPE